MTTTDEKNLNVLIADDSQNMLRTLANMLRVLGFKNISRADNGETALVKLRSEKIGLVLCDWNMPRMTGVEVLRAIREDDRLREIPFLMITGEVDRNIVAEAGEQDVDGYLLKPFTQEDLKTKIEEVITKRRTPSQVEVHLSVARVYMEARQWAQAMNEVKAAVKLAPRNPRVSLALGQIFEAQGENENALKLYERSVEFGHQFLKGHVALARMHQVRGDVEEAAKHLKKAVAISPKNLDRQINLSQVLIKTGDKDGVRKVLSNVMTMADKNRSEVARQVGEAYMEAGMAAEAEKAFQQALEADPSDILLYNRMGMALRRQKKINEAIGYYRKAIQLEPENENLYYNIGRAYYEAGDVEKARGAMRKALTIYPEFQEAKDFLAKVGVD